MANRKNQAEIGGELPDLAGATQLAGLAIRDLQSRLGGRTVSRPADAEDATAPSDELDKQLQHYFDRTGAASASVPPSVLEALREKVVEGVVERILREWKQPGSTSESLLQQEVMDRLIARVLERMGAGGE